MTIDWVSIGPWVGIGLVSAGVAFGVWVVHDILFERHQVFQSLRAARSMAPVIGAVRSRELANTFGSRVMRPLVGNAGGLARRFTPQTAIKRLEQDLIYAGSPRGWDPERILALKVLAAAFPIVLAVVLGATTDVSTARLFVLGAILAALATYAPEWVLRSYASRRQLAIRLALPDAIDLLAITVGAGLGFDAALDRVARESGGPLGSEFVRVLREIQLGKPRTDALRAMADRTTVDEMRSFVLAMTQADRFGVSVRRVLQVQADESRTRRRQRAEELSHKMPVKMTFPLIACLLPALLAVILGPGILRIARQLIH